MSKSVLPLFSSKSFIVSSLIFISLIHFSSFLCMMLKNVLISFFFTCRCPVSQAPCTEETVFSPLYSLAPFVVDEMTVGAWIYCWAFYPILLICLSVLCQNYSHLMTVGSQYNLKSRNLITPAPLFFLKFALTIQVLFCLYTK